MSHEPCLHCGNYHPGLDDCPPARYALALGKSLFPSAGPWPGGGGFASPGNWLCPCHYENSGPICTHCGLVPVRFMRMGSGRIVPVLREEDCHRYPPPLSPECPCLWGEACNPEIHCPECGLPACTGLHGSD